jgi:very-short-patch-repair endonuclease
MRADQDVVVGHVRRHGWTRVGFGLHRREGQPDELHADLVAWQEVLPESGCLTHLTGAVLHGLWLPPLPDDLPVFVSMSKKDTRPKRPELLVMRHTRPIRTTRRDGLLVATVDEVLLTCARDLGLLDLAVLGDAALRLGLTSKPALQVSAARRRWGAARLLNAVGWMDARSESPWESVMRVFHRACGVPVVPQHVVLDEQGGFVARGDLWIEGSRMLHEYDGAVHRERRTHVEDLARDRRLLAAGWHRRGYTAADLLHRPAEVLRDADLTLGRRHRADRLDPWLRLLEESLFHPAGQERFVRRLGGRASGRSWQRHAG